jgi:hypothetical protein
MAKREVRYYFGRLNIVAPRTDKAGLLTDGMQPQAIVSHRGLNWGFFRLNTVESSLGDFVHGFLVKFKPETAEEIAIPETHEIDDRMIENRIKAKARFFLHLSSHIIAYHPFRARNIQGGIRKPIQRTLRKESRRFFCRG